MNRAQKVKNKSVEEPRKRLEWLLVALAFIACYFYLYIYQNMLHIEVRLVSFAELIRMAIVTLVIFPLIRCLIIAPDPLQRSPSQRKSIRFFQNEFPSKYILDRCKRCIENESSCPNYIKAESYAHTRYWFNDIFRGAIENENPRLVKDTFRKGYYCKVLYYLSGVLDIFLVLGIVTIVVHHIYLCVFDKCRVDLTPLQIIFLLACAGIIISIRKLNNPDENTPSGCWQAWREINRMHVSWLRSHEDFLVKLICQASGGTKKFKEE